MLNWTPFQHARIVIGSRGDGLGHQGAMGRGPVPELYVRELQTWKTFHAAADGEEVMPGITARVTPGHTPGHLIYVLKGQDHDVIFTGDAAKNRVNCCASAPTAPMMRRSARPRLRQFGHCGAAGRGML